MNAPSSTDHRTGHLPGRPRAHPAPRATIALTGGYLGLSVLTLVAVVLLRHNAGMVNDAVWVRTAIVVVSASLTFAFAVRAARGSRPALRRLRIVSTAMTLAIAVIVALPGPFPLWLKVEQGICGLLLLGVVLLVSGRRPRAALV
jgi:hypothetical protein